MKQTITINHMKIETNCEPFNAAILFNKEIVKEFFNITDELDIILWLHKNQELSVLSALMDGGYTIIINRNGKAKNWNPYH